MMVHTESVLPVLSVLPFHKARISETEGSDKRKNIEVSRKVGKPGQVGQAGQSPINQIVSRFDYQDSPAPSSPALEPPQPEPIDNSDEHDDEPEIIEQPKYTRTLIRSIAAPANHTVGLIGPPSPMLLVRGPSLSPTYCRSSEIPAEATECMHIAAWFPIRDHWRGGGR